MRIGILTLPLHTNYGGILQAYALQTVLENMGHEVYLISEEKKELSHSLYGIKTPFKILKRCIEKLVLRKNIIIFYEAAYNHMKKQYIDNANVFISTNINSYLVKNVKLLPHDVFDVIVVGSDQIWRPLYYPNIENAFLSFTIGWNIKRISYAPSFGTDVWEYSNLQTLKCKELLSMFDGISVREAAGLLLCQKFLGKMAKVVLDPTLLLPVSTYDKLIEKFDNGETYNKIVVYVLTMTSDKMKLIKHISKTTGKEIVYMQTGPSNSSEQEINKPIPIERWVSNIKNAFYVITDSFHATAFSIIYHKNFIVYGNKGGGLSRFDSILDLFELKDRYILSSSDYLDLDKKIDYNRIDSLLEIERGKSMSFLKSVID